MKRTIPLTWLLRIAFVLACLAVVSLAQQSAGTLKPNQGSQANSESPAQASEESGVLRLVILDSATGYAVGGASVSWGMVSDSVPPHLPNSGIAGQTGRLRLTLSPGKYAFEVSAPGYESMRTHWDVVAKGADLDTINLNPINPPPELRDDVVAAQLRDGYELLHGYVVDSAKHRPLSGVKLRLQESGAAAVTDARGYFQIYAPAVSASEAKGPEDLAATDTLVATAKGYMKYVFEGLLHHPGQASVVVIQMQPGRGVVRRREEHGFMPPGAPRGSSSGSVGPISNAFEAWISVSGEALPVGGASAAPEAALLSIGLPTSIIVGSNCGNTAQGYGCTTATTYAFETYVQDGLDNEWFGTAQLSDWFGALGNPGREALPKI